MSLWLLVLGMGLLTFLLRLALVLGANRLELPPTLQQGLKYAPPAVLSAIIALELAAPAGTIDLTPSNFRLVAGVVATVVAWRTRNVLITIAVGMIVLWMLQWVGTMRGV